MLLQITARCPHLPQDNFLAGLHAVHIGSSGSSQWGLGDRARSMPRFSAAAPSSEAMFGPPNDLAQITTHRLALRAPRLGPGPGGASSTRKAIELSCVVINCFLGFVHNLSSQSWPRDMAASFPTKVEFQTTTVRRFDCSTRPATPHTFFAGCFYCRAVLHAGTALVPQFC
jgi:hypothetical protein